MKTVILNCNNISQYYYFTVFFFLINAALVSIRDFQNHYKILPTPNFWTVLYFLKLAHTSLSDMAPIPLLNSWWHFRECFLPTSYSDCPSLTFVLFSHNLSVSRICISVSTFWACRKVLQPSWNCQLVMHSLSFAFFYTLTSKPTELLRGTQSIAVRRMASCS